MHSQPIHLSYLSCKPIINSQSESGWAGFVPGWWGSPGLSAVRPSHLWSSSWCCGRKPAETAVSGLNHAQTHTHTHTRTNTRAGMHTHTHTHTSAHMITHNDGVGGDDEGYQGDSPHREFLSSRRSLAVTSHGMEHTSWPLPPTGDFGVLEDATSSSSAMRTSDWLLVLFPDPFRVQVERHGTHTETASLNRSLVQLDASCLKTLAV